MLQDGGLSHSQDLWLVDLQFWEPSLLSIAISSPTCLPTMCLNVQRRCDTLHAQDMCMSTIHSVLNTLYEMRFFPIWSYGGIYTCEKYISGSLGNATHNVVLACASQCQTP